MVQEAAPITPHLLPNKLASEASSSTLDIAARLFFLLPFEGNAICLLAAAGPTIDVVFAIMSAKSSIRALLLKFSTVSGD